MTKLSGFDRVFVLTTLLRLFTFVQLHGIYLPDSSAFLPPSLQTPLQNTLCRLRLNGFLSRRISIWNMDGREFFAVESKK